jgi:nucleotide-binding universal stress UspA family protein
MAMDTGKPHGAVVVGVDGSEQSLVALDWAVETARLDKRPLHVVHAHGWLRDRDPDSRVIEAAKARVALLDPTMRVTCEDVDGSGESALIGASRMASMVCVGSHGRGGVGPRLLGSTALSVAASALCPVAVIRTMAIRGDRAPRIVVGVDESSGSHDAVGFAFAQADLRAVRLTGVHAWHASDRLGLSGFITPSDKWQAEIGNEEAALAESLAGWAEKYPDVQLSRVSIRKPQAEAILREAGGAVLIVLGSRQPRPRPDLVGSPTVRQVLQDAPCPVVVVPQNTA